jgi:hypothetical protein
MEVVVGDYVVGFGILFEVVDKWHGSKDTDVPQIMLANVSNDRYTWMTRRAFDDNFDKVEKHALGG